MHVAICIVAFKNPTDVLECLAALSQSVYEDYEVVVCENGDHSARAHLADLLPSQLSGGQAVRLIHAGGNVGYAGGVNACIAASSDADAWWVLNPDTLPDLRALEALVGRFALGDCAAIGCTLHYPDGQVQSRGGRWNPWFARAVSIDHGKDLGAPAASGALLDKATYLSGASMLVGRKFIETIGLMQESYFLYAEEVEWCVRAVQAGLKLSVSINARVVHKQGTTTGSVRNLKNRSRTSVYLDERNKMLLTRDRFPAHLPVAAVAGLILVILRFGRRFAWRQLAYGIDGWWAGLNNRRGRPAWISA